MQSKKLNNYELNRKSLPRPIKLLMAGLVSGAFLFLPQSAFSQSVQGYEPPYIGDGKAHIEEAIKKFGNFEVVRIVRDYRSVPILHGPWLEKESKLIWRDSNKGVELTLLDNGNSITLSLTVRVPESNLICLIPGGYVKPNPQPSISKNWETYEPYLAELLTKCETLGQSDTTRILGDVVDSKIDYANAANFWKETSIELFGSSSRRCVKDKFDGYMISNLPLYRCVKWSE